MMIGLTCDLPCSCITIWIWQPAVQRFLGGEHVAEHGDPNIILPQVQGLSSTQVYNDFKWLLCYGAPAKYKEHGSCEEFIAYWNYGNHKSLSKNPVTFCKAMNKEDKREYILTFPAYLKDFILDLWLTPNGLLQIPGKNDRVIFDSSFLLHAHSRAFNFCINKDCKPDIVFGHAWFRYLQRIYNLWISFPSLEILLFDDDVVAAFCQVKYHPNVISSKGYCDNRYVFIPTGLTFGDTPSPPSFEPFAGAHMALATNLNCQAKDSIPQYDDYLSAVQFAPLPPPRNGPIHSGLSQQFQPGCLTRTVSRNQQNTICM
jgi:hypothetical protein